VRKCLTCDGRFEDPRRICPQDGDVLIAEGVVTADTGRVLAGKYRLGNLIGSGGMGQVFEAVALASGEAVAVKLLKQGLVDRNASKRFEREAEAMAILSHPGIVRFLEFCRTEDGTTFLAMELLAGPTFSELRRAGKFASVERVVDLMREACGVVAAAHAKGIVHRDLKPSNIILHRAARDLTQVKVLDFGIAKFLDWTGEGLTSTGELIGTLQYMAPEQSGGRAVTPASDVYSLGAVMFEALAGRLPFVGRSAAEMMWLQASAPIPSLSTFRPDIPQGLEELVARCLAKKPENRHRDAGEMAQALEALREAPAGEETAERTRTLRINPSLLVGSVLDERYELHEWISPGRFRSHVYRAAHLRTGASVAVRVWKTGRGAVRDFLIEAFRNEARAMGVRHSNLIAIVDLGFTDDCVYIVTEYVDSLSLRTILQKRPALPRGLAARLIHGAADALGALHGRGIVSGGLSPETIRVTGTVEHPGELLLTPMGLTSLRQMEALLDPSGDAEGERLRDYMSPEQRAGRPPDPRSDIYSLGLLFIEMLGGRVHEPLGAGPGTDLPPAVPEQRPVFEGAGLAVPSLPYGLPLEWGEFLRRTIAPDPGSRIQTIAELVAALPAE
jgi:serine/threonine protein kinase